MVHVSVRFSFVFSFFVFFSHAFMYQNFIRLTISMIHYSLCGGSNIRFFAKNVPNAYTFLRTNTGKTGQKPILRKSNLRRVPLHWRNNADCCRFRKTNTFSRC